MLRRNLGWFFACILLPVLLATPMVASSDCIVGNAHLPDAAFCLAVSGSHAYTFVGSGILLVVDVSDPASPAVVDTFSVGSVVYGMAISGSYLYAARGGAGVSVLDISDPSSPVVVGHVDTPGSAQRIVVSGSYAYLADGEPGLETIDITNPAVPVIVGGVVTGTGSNGVAVSGSYAYVSASPGLEVVDISNPLVPVIVGTNGVGGRASCVSGGYVYLEKGEYGLSIVDVTNPASPTVVANVSSTWVDQVSVSGSLAFVTGWGTYWMSAFDVSNPASPVLAWTEDLGSGPGGENTNDGSHIYVTHGIPASLAQDLTIIRLSSDCFNPVIHLPASLNGMENAYFTATITATHPLQDELSMSLLGTVPSWLTFSDLGNGTAWLRGTPGSGQAQTYSMQITASVPTASNTASFSIVIGPAPPYQSTTVYDTLGTSGFSPGFVRIHPTDTVIWRFEGHGSHTTTNGTGPADPDAGTLWDGPLSSQSPAWSHQFLNPGTYPYFCRKHPSETGTVVVSFSTVGIGEEREPHFRLVPAANPFRNSVDLHFDLDRAECVRIIILDIQGRRVQDLLSADLPAGPHQVMWTGRNENLQPVPPGVYFVRLTTGDGRSLAQKLFKTR